MDRTSVAVLLWLGSAWSTPRDSSDITYVRIQPLAAHQAARAQLPLPPPLPALRESRIEHLPLTIGSGGESVRRPRSDPEPPTPTPEESPTAAELESTTEAATTPEEPVERLYERRVPGPRFYSKLSYFSKDDASAVSTNLVGDGGKRKYRSRCRCERIWNCPKLQISVARCPDEYFLCCF